MSLPDHEALLSVLPPGVRQHCFCVCLINSLAEGFGNSVSDIDLMVLLDKEPGAADRDYWEPAFLSGRRIDVNYIDQELVRRRLRETGGAALSGASIDFAHKIRSSKPLSHESNHEQLLAEFDWRAFDQQLCSYHLQDTHLRLEDIFGSLQEDEHANAALNTRVLLNEVLDAFLASLGESQPRGKWRLKKARRALGYAHPLIELYLERMLGPVPWDGDNTRWVRRSIDLVRYLRTRIMLDLSDQALPVSCVVNEPTWLVHPAFAYCTGGAPGYSLHNPAPRLKLGVVQAVAWMLAPYQADIRSWKVAIEGVAEGGKIGFAPPNQKQLELLLTEFLQRQVILRAEDATGY